MVSKTCFSCSKTYVPNSNRQQFCGDINCRRERDRKIKKQRIDSGKHAAYAKRQYQLSHPKQTKICPVCNSTFTVRIKNDQKYCSPHCATKIYISNHREQRRKDRQAFRQWWGRTGGRHNYTAIKQSELLGQDILEQLGYKDVKRITAYLPSFPFDLKALEGDEIILVDVTQNTHHRVERRRQLLTDLHLRGYMLFIKPDNTTYALVEILPVGRTYIDVPRELLVSWEGGV